MPETSNAPVKRVADFRPSSGQVTDYLGTPIGAAVVVFPRPDGLYPGVTSDFVALLRETGVSVDYATDPTAARGWQHKSGVEQYLPAILIAVGDAATLLSTIDSIASVVSSLLGRARPGTRLHLDVGRRTDPDGATVEWASLEASGDPKGNGQMVREVMRTFFEG